MKPSPSPHDLEVEFADVIDTLKLQDLSLRKERRAIVLAAFGQACAGSGRQRNAWLNWACAAGLAAAIVAVAFVSSTLFAPKPNSSALGSSRAPLATAATTPPQAEHPALGELNVTLAIVNARAAAVEQELAWLTAMRAEIGREKERFDSQLPDPLKHQP